MRLFPGFYAHALGDKFAAEIRVDERDQPSAATHLQPVFDRGRGRGLHMPLRHNGVHQSERPRAAGVDVAAGKHHCHRFERIDQPRQAHRPAEAGVQAEHDFGKAEPRIINCDPIIAGEREFEPAA